MTHNKQHNVCTLDGKQQGFTLVEFMVASVLGLIVIAGAGSLYAYTKRLNDVGMARVTTLQDLRTAATMITQDARNAGVFGCANLGRRFAPDGTDCQIALENVNPTVTTGGAGMGDVIKLQTLDDPNPNNRSAGVRWFSAGSVPNIWGGVNFTPASGALLFYYGEGSLSFNSSGAGTVTFNTDEKNPNQVVKSILETQPGGWVVAAGCNTLAFQHSAGGHSGSTFPVTTLPAGAVSSASNANGVLDPNAIIPHSDMVLQRYKIVAYVVGTVAGEPEPSALYRFEFGNNGNSWSPPQKLAKNVTNMTAQYLFVTDCPTAKATTGTGSGGASTAIDLNTQAFTVRDAGVANAIEDDETVSPNYGKADAMQGPSSIRLQLTYDFPDIRGGTIATGGKNQTFNISAVVRGGNVCASRKIAQ